MTLAVLVALCVQPQLLSAKGVNSTKGKLTDNGITKAVEMDLLIDPGVSSQLIDVKSKSGIVTLSGSVDNLLSKERAVKITKSIRGVRAVVNELKVRPAMRTDSDLRTDIEKALSRDPATDAYPLSVGVTNGVATLRGQVQSWQEKQLSAEVAMGVRGVKGIINEITWKWTPNRPDSAILADIDGRLQSDIWVDRAPITVSVQNSDVELRGKVGSAIEQDHAFADAWVEGVKRVDDSHLSVDPWLRNANRRNLRLPPPKSDTQIAQAIKNAFLYDPRVYPFDPTVEVDNGIVTLTGVVDNLKAKQAAAQDALNTLGVWNIVNLLKVRQPSPPSDAEIAKNIREALAASPFVNGFDVTVNVVNQSAYLYGTADSAFEKREAGRMAAGVKGVVLVQNDINVPHYAYGYPGWSNYSYYNRPMMVGPVENSAKEDQQIKRDIKDQFFWSPFLNGDKLHVSVKDRVATLSGTVDSRMARGAAVDNAYQGGALAVRDEIKVKPTS